MFTSRLPTSTSVRRPTGHTDGSKSFVGPISRQSNIPVTVRKANLFTPQTKGRTYQSGGATTTGKSYLSGLATDKKFQRTNRPAPDRDEQLKMFDNLVEFLNAHAPFPPPEAKKFFSSVSTTESTRIFELLISRIIPDFKITRLETDVPEALGLLDYPFLRTVTRSSLVSVTTRQAAVSLLCIFNWLVTRIKFQDEDSTTQDSQCDDDERAQLLNILLTQPDCIEDASQALFDKLHPADDSKSLYHQKEQLDMELERLNEDKQERQAYASEVQEVFSDLEKCHTYGQELEDYIQKISTMTADIEREAKIISEPSKDEEERILKSEIDKHEFDIVKIKEKSERIKALESEVNSLNDELKQNHQDPNAKYANFLQDLQKGKCERISLYKEFESLYTNADVNSDLLHDLIHNLRERIVCLEQSTIHDLSDSHKFNHDHGHEHTKSVMTRSRIEDDLNNILNEERQIVQKVEADINKIETGELPRLTEREKRLDWDIEAEKSKSISTIQNLKAEIEVESSRSQHSFDEELETKKISRDDLFSRLEELHKLVADSDHSDEQRVQLFIKTGMMEMHRLSRILEDLSTRITDDSKISQQNLENLRKVCRSLKKKGFNF